MAIKAKRTRSRWSRSVIAFVGVLVLPFLWWSHHTTAFAENEVEQAIPALLEQKIAEGMDTFLWPDATDISCEVVAKQDGNLLVDIHWTGEGEASTTRQVLPGTLLFDRYTFNYDPINTEEESVLNPDDSYPEVEGDEYTGRSLLRRYLYVCDPETHEVIDSAWNLTQGAMALTVAAGILVLLNVMAWFRRQS